MQANNKEHKVPQFGVLQLSWIWFFRWVLHAPCYWVLEEVFSKYMQLSRWCRFQFLLNVLGQERTISLLCFYFIFWHPLPSGTTSVHAELEECVAKYVGKPAAIVTGMGFATNSAIIPVLIGKVRCHERRWMLLPKTYVLVASLSYTGRVDNKRFFEPYFNCKRCSRFRSHYPRFPTQQ